MAALNTNEILNNILGQIVIMNKNMQSGSLKQADTKTAKATNPTGVSVKSALGAAGDAANAVKTLASVSIKDVAKISVMPLDKIAVKISKFVEELSKIDKKSIENAKLAIDAYNNITELMMKNSPIKLSLYLAMYPHNMINLFIHRMGNTIDLLALVLLKKFSGARQIQMNKALFAIRMLERNLIKVVKQTALIGVVGTLALPLIILGFGVIAFTLVGLNLVSRVVSIQGNPVKAAKDRANLNNITGFARGVAVVLLASIAIGALLLLVPNGPKMILLGLGTVAATVLVFAGIAWLMNKVVGGTKSKQINQNVKSVLLFAFGSMLIALAGIGLGLLIKKTGWAIAIGLGATLATIAAFGGIAFLLGKLKKHFTKAKEPMLLVLGLGLGSIILAYLMLKLGQNVNEAGGWAAMGSALGAVAATITEFGVIAGLMGVLKSTLMKGSLVYALILGLGYFSIQLTGSMVDLGTKMKEAGGWATLGPALGAVAAIIGEFALIAGAIGALMMIPFLPLIMGAGIATVAAIGGAAMLVGSAANDFMDVALKMKQGISMKEAMSVVTDFMDGMVSIIQDIGDATKGLSMWSITKLMFTIDSIIHQTGRFANILKTVGGKKGFMKAITGWDDKGNPIYDMEGIDIALTSKNLADGFSTFVTIVIGALSELKGKVVSFNTIATLRLIMDPLDKFCNMLKNVGGKEGYMKSISGWDKDGHPIYDPKGIDIALTSNNIAKGFAMFSLIVIGALSKLKDKVVSFNTIATLRLIMEPVERFANILKSFSTGKDGEICISNFDNEGKVTSKEVINIEQVSTTLASGFIAFSTKMIDAIKEMDTGFGTLFKSVKITKTIEPILELVKQLVDILGEDSRKKYMTNVFAISATFPRFAKAMMNINKGFNNVPRTRVVERFVDNIKTLIEGVLTSFDNKDTAKKFLTYSIYLGMGIKKLSDSTISDNILKSHTKSSINIIENLSKNIGTISEGVLKSFKNDSEGSQFVKNATFAAKGLEELNKIYVSNKTMALNKMIPQLTKNHTEFITKMKKALKDIKDPLSKYTESVEKLAKAYDRLKKHYDNEGKLVLTLDEHVEDNHTNNYDLNTNAVRELLDGYPQEVSAAIIEALKELSLNIPANAFKNPNGTSSKEISITID